VQKALTKLNAEFKAGPNGIRIWSLPDDASGEAGP
jgi:hypothetical protein